MPFPGEKEDHRPCVYLLRFTRLGGKVPATFRYIYQLILIQDAPGLRLEIILLRMPGKRIGATRRDELISDRRDDDSPFLIRSCLLYTSYLGVCGSFHGEPGSGFERRGPV